MGRSRGGLTTKIHALADLACDLVALRLTPGQAGDNPRLLGLLDDWLDNGGLDATEIELLADKAYSHPSTRRELDKRGIAHTIPERKDQIARRDAQRFEPAHQPRYPLAQLAPAAAPVAKQCGSAVTSDLNVALDALNDRHVL